MSAGTPWRTSSGRVGVEVARKEQPDGLTLIRLMFTEGVFLHCEWVNRQEITREPARYEGARGGHGACAAPSATGR